MGIFDYERLKSTVNNFSYNLFNFPADFSKSIILENSYDGIVYEKRTTEFITSYDSSNKPVKKEVNRFNPILDLKIMSEEKAKALLIKNGATQFAYRVKEIGTSSSETVANISKFSKLVSNSKFFIPIARSLQKTKPTNIFNDNIFKVTKLREDIYFIKVSIKQQDKPRINTILAVNDRTFWKRFTIRYTDPITNEETKLNAKDFDYSASDIITDCINNPSNFSIKMYYIYDEKDRQIEYFNTTYPDLENPKDSESFIDPEIAVVEFVGVSHYNKRTWLAILISDGSGIIYTDNTDIPNLESYKTVNSNTYYAGDESEICMAYR
jgi:hypothetical protein